jgi:hypothetical protein
MPNSFSLRRTACAAILVVPCLVAACGARGPLDIVVVEGQLDAAVDVTPGLDAQAVDAPGEAAAEAGDHETGPAGFDAGPLVNCGACLAQQCGTQIFACLTASACQTTLQCAVTMCISGGAPDIACVLKCANGDAQAIGQLTGLFGCITSNCSECLGALGALGGLGGGGGGGGGNGTGGGLPGGGG